MEKEQKSSTELDKTSSEESITSTTSSYNHPTTTHTSTLRPTNQPENMRTNPRNVPFQLNPVEAKEGSTSIDINISGPSTSSESGSRPSTSGALSLYCLYEPPSESSVSTVSVPEEIDEEADDDEGPPQKKVKKEDL